MDAPVLGKLDDVVDVDLELLGFQTDRQPARNEAAVSGPLENGTQLANDLTQGCACFHFIGTAP